MDEYLTWIDLHSQTLLLIGLSILGFGVLTSFIGRSRRKANTPTQDRRVRVGRDNTGTIITGNLGPAANPGGDLLSKVGNWASIIGLLIGIISIIPLLHGWLQMPVK
jgi:hypothetical protein